MPVDFQPVGPLKILGKTARKALGRGNMGVLVARAGVGKTACLIHMALDKLLRREKLVHVSLDESPEKVQSYYEVISSDLFKALEHTEGEAMKALIQRNRMILAFMNRSFDIQRLQTSLANLKERVAFVPDGMIVDGVDFANAERSLFESFKTLAAQNDLEVWFSALSHRHMPETNPRGIPYPCHHVDDLFSLIIRLEPGASGVVLRLLKDHEGPVTADVGIRLDPDTFLASE